MPTPQRSIRLSKTDVAALNRGKFTSGELFYAKDGTLRVYDGTVTGGASILTTAVSVGTVHSVALSAPSIFTVAGSPITNTGTLALSYSGTALPTANGGTGQITYARGQLLIGNDAGTLGAATLTEGSNITITNGNGTITIAAAGYTLPTATTTVLGGVKVDGSTITVSGGVISANLSSYVTSTSLTSTLTSYATTSSLSSYATTSSLSSYATTSSLSSYVTSTSLTSTLTSYATTSSVTSAISAAAYSLPTASTSVLGGIKIDGSTLAFNAGGQLYYTGAGAGGYTLPTASTSQLGGVKIDGSTITLNGSSQLVAAAYSLPTASISVLGGVQVDGSTITISSGVISSAATSSRSTASVTSTSLANSASGTFTIVGFKGYLLYSIQTSQAAWVVLYTSSAARTADSARTETTDPLPNAGVVAEIITTGADTVVISPAVVGFNSAGLTDIPIKITNKSGSPQTITVTVTLVKMEA